MDGQSEEGGSMLSRLPNGLWFRANCNRQSRLFLSQLRCRMSFLGMLHSRLGVLATSFVSSLTAILRRGAMALGGVLMQLRSDGVRFDHVGSFVHGNAPFLKTRMIRDEQIMGTLLAVPGNS
jgi:hypothetical protein